MTAVRARLPAAARREALVDVALGLFAAGSYRGVTTAEIARAAGVSEPILYRHFDSKRELFLACLEEAWTRLRSEWELAVSAEPPRFFAPHSNPGIRRAKELLWDLWAQAFTEAVDDATFKRHLRRHLAEVHGYVAEGIRKSQEAGHVLPDRDAEAEAWIFMSTGLMAAIGRRIGGLLEKDVSRIVASRREWMTGAKEPPGVC
jgi:AcrR family transcriptional regulator